MQSALKILIAQYHCLEVIESTLQCEVGIYGLLLCGKTRILDFYLFGGGDYRHLSRIRIEMLKFASLLKNTGDTFLTFHHFIHFF